jgi:hypothetical protein
VQLGVPYDLVNTDLGEERTTQSPFFAEILTKDFAWQRLIGSLYPRCTDPHLAAPKAEATYPLPCSHMLCRKRALSKALASQGQICVTAVQPRYLRSAEGGSSDHLRDRDTSTTAAFSGRRNSPGSETSD